MRHPWLYKHSRPVNLHPLFLFWKHRSVCDPEKYQVQNMDLKKARWKNGVIVIQKEKRQPGLCSFWITMTPFFHLSFFRSIFWTWLFSGSQTDPCFQNKNGGCRLTGCICTFIQVYFTSLIIIKSVGYDASHIHLELWANPWQNWPQKRSF